MFGLDTLGWKIVEKPLGRLSSWLTEGLLRRYRRNRIRSASGRKAGILLARLVGDNSNGSIRETIREMIRKEFGYSVEIILWPEELSIVDGHEYDVERGAYETAQKWLTSQQCDLLIWGRIKAEGFLSLHITIAGFGTPGPENYKLTEAFELPTRFISDFGTAIAARIAATAISKFSAPDMYRVVERLKPFLANISPAYDADTCGVLWYSYAHLRLVIGERTGNIVDIRDAATSFSAALEQFSRKKNPLLWGLAQNGLGYAYLTLGLGAGNVDNFKRALNSFGLASKEISKHNQPYLWAAIQLNTGIAEYSFGKMHPEKMVDALRSFRRALTVWTSDCDVVNWASVQCWIGATQLLVSRNKMSRDQKLEVCEVFETVLAILDCNQTPVAWAYAKNGLATALLSFGQLQNDTIPLQQSASAFREALKIFTREQYPCLWAITKTNLGATLQALGERSSGIRYYEESVAAHKEALSELKSDRTPLLWALAMSNLGDTLHWYFNRDGRVERLRDAISTLEQALTVRKPDLVPLDWAASQLKFGAALRDLGARRDEIEYFERATAIYNQILEKISREHAPIIWAMTQNNLGVATEEIAKRKKVLRSYVRL